MPDEYASVTADGLEFSSNSESQEEMQEILGVKADETPPEKPPETPAEKPAPKPEEKAEATDRDEKGRFKAKPIPDKKEEVKAEGESKEEKPPEEAKPEEAKPEEEGKDKKSRPGRLDARQRVEQATRAAAEDRRQRDAAIRENQALRQALGVRKEAAPKEKPRAENAPPELTEGKDPVEFVQETSEWAAKKAQREADQKRQEEEHVARFQQEVERREKNILEDVEKHIKTDPDFTERIDPRLMNLQTTWQALAEGKRPSAWNVIIDEITDSSVPAKMMIYFSEHEEEIQRIATLGPRALTKAMAKIEAKLEAATAGTPAPEIPPYKPSAAEPVTPVTGAATTAETELDPETASFEDWFRVKNAQDRKRGRRV